MPAPITSPPGDGRPVLLYDGQCPFCTAQARRLETRAAGRLSALSYHDPGVLDRFPGIAASDCEKEMKLVTRDGAVLGGPQAVLHAVQVAYRIPGLAAVGSVPGLRWLAELAYAAVARNRYRIFGQAPACDGDACRLHVPPVPSSGTGTGPSSGTSA